MKAIDIDMDMEEAIEVEDADAAGDEVDIVDMSIVLVV